MRECCGLPVPPEGITSPQSGRVIIQGNELAHEEYTRKTEKYAPAAHAGSTGAGFP